MAMATRFVFRAMAEQGDGLLLSQMLEQSQGELLPVILDSFVANIYSADFTELLQITTAVLRPRYPAGEDSVAQVFARPEIGHPDVETVGWQAAPSPSSGQNSEAVFRFERAVNRFGFEHDHFAAGRFLYPTTS
jgi:hypothetical protein